MSLQYLKPFWPAQTSAMLGAKRWVCPLAESNWKTSP